MKKIQTLFVRDWDGDRRYVLPEVAPGCEWVLKGEGVPTRKYDGTCVMFAGLAEWLHAHPYEVIVWHHPDGRMAKIKKRDFPK